jgi:hypothetical protein
MEVYSGVFTTDIEPSMDRAPKYNTLFDHMDRPDTDAASHAA